MNLAVKQRFLSKVALPNENGCMIWLAGTNGHGYGIFAVARRKVQAHRFGYELWVGPIPDGLQLDHLCRVRNCAAPAHLEPVTNRENTLRGEGTSARYARQTHCREGHPLAGDNLLPADARRGTRRCRTCRLAYQRAWKRERYARLKKTA